MRRAGGHGVAVERLVVRRLLGVDVESGGAHTDIVVAFVSTKDVGTAFELGHAYRAGIPIYLLVYDIDDVAESKTNLMLAMSAKGIFTLSNWIDFLLDNMNNMEFIEIKNKWEGIE